MRSKGFRHLMVPWRTPIEEATHEPFRLCHYHILPAVSFTRC